MLSTGLGNICGRVIKFLKESQPTHNTHWEQWFYSIIWDQLLIVFFYFILFIFLLFYILATVSHPSSLHISFPLLPSTPPHPLLRYLHSERSRLPMLLTEHGMAHQGEVAPSSSSCIKADQGNPEWERGSHKPAKSQG